MASMEILMKILSKFRENVPLKICKQYNVSVPRSFYFYKGKNLNDPIHEKKLPFFGPQPAF